MIDFTPRKFKFKAWNKSARLLMKLSAIDCVKGELMMRDHVLLQFTGLYDYQQEEIYEMDLLLIGKEKYVVRWDDSSNAWFLSQVTNLQSTQPLLKDTALKAMRLCSFFESEHNR